MSTSKASALELSVINLTIKMFSEPVLELDLPLLEQHLEEVRDRKAELLAACEADPETLNSNPKFAELLRSLGVEPPMKISPATGKETYALAKNDEGLKELLEHEDERVQAVVAARLGTKSTLEETRTERFIGIAKRGSLPVPLSYYAAHTGRWGGSGGVNIQNLPSRGNNTLKSAILPPPGHVIIDCDSSQIEARVLAWLSGQDDLVEAFANKQDVYKIMASKIYNKEIQEITKEERFLGKTVVLGCGYGLGAAKFQSSLKSSGVTLELEECKHIITTYRESYPAIPALWKQGQRCLEAMLTGQTAPIGVRPDALYLGADGFVLPSGYVLKYPDLRKDEEGQFSYKARNGRVKIYGGKVIENCIAGGTEVLTDRGWVFIENVQNSDRIHDGVEFVNHGGKIFKSVQTCVSIDGVWMTPDHEVLTDDGWKAASQNPRPYRPDLRSVDGYESRAQRWEEAELALPVPVRSAMRESWGGGFEGDKARRDAKLRLFNKTAYFQSQHQTRYEQASGIRRLEKYARSMSASFTQGVEKLRRSRNYGLSSVARSIREFLGGHGGFVCSWFGFRPDRQQRPLFTNELPMGFPSNEHYEQAKYAKGSRRSETKRRNGDLQIDALLQARARMAERNAGTYTQRDQQVYDILNAGPRQRFVVRGNSGPFIVHNCVQGLARCVIAEQMVNISYEYRPVMTVHDAIAIVAPVAEAERAQAFVEQCFRETPVWAEGLPLNCESGIGDNYGQC